MTEDAPEATGSIDGRVLAVGAVGAALTALLSLLILAETTSVDANNWLIWAAQAAKGHPIDLAWTQTSFKPLPVLVALPFSAISPFAGNLAWLWLVRFATLICPILLWVLASRRFGWVAGAVAALLPFTLPAWVAFGIDGDSEPVAAALLLCAAVAIAIGRPVATTIALATCSLIRPEALPLLGLWLAWLLRSDGWRKAARHAGPAISLNLIGWALLPALLGTSFDAASKIAHQPLFVTPSREGILALLPLSAWLLVGAGAWGLLHRRDGVITAMAAAAALWVLEVAVMADLGFAGIDRYLYPAVILLCAVAGVGASAVATLGRIPSVRTAIGLMLIAFVSHLVASGVHLDRENITSRRDQAESARRAVLAFERSGGMARWSECKPFAAPIGRSVILARILAEPISIFTPYRGAPTIAFDQRGPDARGQRPPIVVGDGSPRIVGVAKPDWRILYFPAGNGCGQPATRPQPAPRASTGRGDGAGSPARRSL